MERPPAHRTPAAESARLARLRQLRRAKDAMDRDWSKPLALMSPDHLDAESAQALKTMISKGVLGAGAFRTDDCRGDYETFTARGVEFVQEPKERPYGIEAIFRDDNGNWFSLTQRNAELDLSKDWS
ncbi:VOC family protein [Streptomyces sp. NPDC017979]|uniref:VOC family protein n=1 Tax=Streptomyces sp. NPDC017979 TaxID=3365024 RepID=UPI0037936D15